MKKEEAMVNMSLSTLINECSLSKKTPEDIFLDFCIKNRENVHKVFKYKKFNYDFTNYLTNYITEDTIVGMIRPSYEEFLYSLVKILNGKITKKIVDDDQLTELLNKKIKQLQEIETEEELKNKFPYIYDDLIQGRQYIKEIERLEKQNPNYQKYYNEQKHYYYSCALKRRLDRFISTQVELYKRLVNKRGEYKERIESESYNSYIKNNFDINKIAIYIIHLYLKRCEKTTNRITLEKYAKIIDKYFKSSYDKSVTITADDKTIVNIENIKARYNNVLRRIKDYESQVQWRIIDKNKNYNRVLKGKNTEPKETIFNYEKLEKLRKIGERKRSFYESTPYLVKVIGLLKYRGYIAYVYENGKVILDREYNDDNPSTALGNAVYCMNAEDFETLSKLDKKTLRKHSKVDTIIHSKYWEKKARSIIELETTPKQQQEAKNLIKKLKEEQ